MNNSVELPDARRVPARAGRYVVIPPPDLNRMEEGDEDEFLLEYMAPHLIVRECALPASSGAEERALIAQIEAWRVRNSPAPGSIGGSREGYEFYVDEEVNFLIPSASYVGHATWMSVPVAEKTLLYRRCVPSVVIELVTNAETMEDLQAKVAHYIAAGTREAVVIDTRQDRVWIYNHGQAPYFDSPLGAIEFDAWPAFTLDCVAIRNARLNAMG